MNFFYDAEFGTIICHFLPEPHIFEDLSIKLIYQIQASIRFSDHMITGI